jgi:hypothetical protein
VNSAHGQLQARTHSVARNGSLNFHRHYPLCPDKRQSVSHNTSIIQQIVAAALRPHAHAYTTAFELQACDLRIIDACECDMHAPSFLQAAIIIIVTLVGLSLASFVP